MTLDKRKKVMKFIKKNWDKHGDCCSCGWHGALYEYIDDDFGINKEKMIIEAHCLSDDENSSSHRGVRIPICKKHL